MDFYPILVFRGREGVKKEAKGYQQDNRPYLNKIIGWPKFARK